MRLGPADEASSSSALNADLVDQIMSISDRRRSRGSAPGSSASSSSYPSGSSLDFKVDPGMKHLLTTPGLPRKENKRTIEQQQLEQQLQQQQQQQEAMRRSSTFTRSRGSGGPPHRKFDLAGLEHLSEEELMQVLYGNELAEADAELARRQSHSSSSGTGRGSRKRTKSKSYTLSDYPEHIQQQMEEGIPFFSWLVVGVGLLWGLYQLRQLLTIPAPSSRHKTLSSKTVKQGKGKKKPDKVVNCTSTRKPSIPDESDHQRSKKSSAPSISSTSKKKKTKKAEANVEKEKRPAPLNGFDKGNTRGESRTQTHLALEQATATTSTQTTTFSGDDSDSGWLPVGKKSGKAGAKSNTGTDIGTTNGTSAPEQAVILQPEPHAYLGLAEQVNGASDDGFQVAGNKTKKKTMRANNSVVSPVTENGSRPNNNSNNAAPHADTDSDAALALQLQEEEQRASRLQQKPREEEWAQVPTKASKKGKH